MIWLAFLLAAQPADKPRDCRDPISQSDMTQCAAQSFVRADKALNAQWKRTLAAMKAADAGYDRQPGDTSSSAGLLLQSQRAWLQYRDAQCRLQSYAMRGGSAAPMIDYGCKARLTTARTRQLADVAEGN